MTSGRPPIPFAGSEFGELHHVCAFFNSDLEEYRVLLPFVKDGFACGDKAIHVVSVDRRDDHLNRLTAAGIDIDAAQESGQFELHIDTEAYLLNGLFDQDRMLGEFERMASANAEGPYPRSRIVCQMAWAAEEIAHINSLVEFEARVNAVWQPRDVAVICVYDLAKFSGDTVIDVMRTHPMVIVGGILQRNPFFVPPEQFLRELRERRAEASAEAPGER